MRRSLLLGFVLAVLSPLVAAPTPASAATTVTARTLLGKLVLGAEANAATYDRALFKHWTDADKDTCDTREEVLIVESTVTASRSTGCKVLKGRWVSMYDGLTWTNPSDVDIDHLVALSEAWKSGASAWTPAKRERFANDLGFSYSLGAMTDNLNSSKGDRDPAKWLPPKSSTHCTYAIRWVAVKYRWALKIDTAERTRLRSLMAGGCGDKSLTLPARGA